MAVEDSVKLRTSKKRRRSRSVFLVTLTTTQKLLVLLWFPFIGPRTCQALPKQDPEFRYWSENIGSLYFSEDEDEERILAALAKAATDEECLYEYYSSFEAQNEPVHEPEPKVRKSHPKPVSQKIENRLSYVTLPEAYRAQPAPLPRPTTPPQQKARETPQTPAKIPDQAIGPALAVQAPSISPWVRQFLASCHRDALLPLPLDYLLDNFNLAQLAPVVERIALYGSSEQERQELRKYIDETQQYPIYRRALQLLVQQDGDNSSKTLVSQTIPPRVDKAARALYLLLHQRFCLSPRGLDMVRRRFLALRSNESGKAGKRSTVFGECPNVSCRNMLLLPYGEYDNFQCLETAVNGTKPTVNLDLHCKRYCCNCNQAFVYRASKVDGCAWGTSFCHLFLMTYGKQFLLEGRKFAGRTLDETTVRKRQQLYCHGKTLLASVFGFRLHRSARSLEKSL